jgi:hypothetical protein
MSQITDLPSSPAAADKKVSHLGIVSKDVTCQSLCFACWPESVFSMSTLGQPYTTMNDRPGLFLSISINSVISCRHLP